MLAAEEAGRAAPAEPAGPWQPLANRVRSMGTSGVRAMTAAKVLVLGGNFAGLTAALNVKRLLGEDADVTVVSKSGQFQFNPSFIWIPFAKRAASEVAFPVARTFESHGVRFVHGEATRIDAATQRVETMEGTFGYDFLVIATGYVNDYGVIPGLGPDGNAYSITSLDGAVAAAVGWAAFLNDPGPVVVGATQGAACFGAAYEFVFNITYHLRKHRIRVPVSYVSPEPFPGHFGVGGMPGGQSMLGMFFRNQHIDGIFDAGMREVTPGEMHLADGRTLPFRYAMVVPPFAGAEVVKTSGLGNPKGFIDVLDTYQTLEYPNVYAVGIAAAVNAPWVTTNAVGVPKTGFPAETMARVAAANIASQVRGEMPVKEENFADIPAVCILDAGNNGVMMLADKMLPPRKRAVMIPGPQSHLAKVAFEKYFLWKARHGYAALP